jgi:hypothetical protein
MIKIDKKGFLLTIFSPAYQFSQGNVSSACDQTSRRKSVAIYCTINYYAFVSQIIQNYSRHIGHTKGFVLRKEPALRKMPNMPKITRLYCRIVVVEIRDAMGGKSARISVMDFCESRGKVLRDEPMVRVKEAI